MKIVKLGTVLGGLMMGTLAVAVLLPLFSSCLLMSAAAGVLEMAPVLAVPEGKDPSALAEWFGGSVTSGYHCAERPEHNGVDFGMPEGTPIRATQGGEVVFAGWSDAGYGNVVIVRNGSFEYYYGHLSLLAVHVTNRVETGTVLGLSGDSGVSTGPHLHYEVRRAGVPLDPVMAPVGVVESGGEGLPTLDELDW